MKKTLHTLVLLAACITLSASIAFANDWQASVGAESKDLGRQALAFLPNEMWIHAGDSITFNFNTLEIHTVTFLTSGQVRPPFQVGCPGFAAGTATFDGSTCVTSPPLTTGQSLTVWFPAAGNYKLTCLVHEDMTGTIHVLDTTATLPYTQAAYDQQAKAQADELLEAEGLGLTDHHHHHGTTAEAGIGKIVAGAGGHDTVSVMRFLQPEIIIHAGQTVEWVNDDPITPHTITFGTEPGNPVPPAGNVTIDADGALHGTLTSTSDSVHSGFIISAPQERGGLPQAPLGHTRFRVTFTTAGVYPYICALHDILGMKGRIVVLP